jgi:hypothetical protein
VQYVVQSNVVLYGCETWSLTSMHEQTPRVLQGTVSRKAFGPQTEEVT